MNHPATYVRTRNGVEKYFDGSATKVWEQLTSDAEVSGIRKTVRAGRDEMRALMLSRLPDDLSGARVLDAGCGTGAMSQHLAQRGADVIGVDISPELLKIAQKRLPHDISERVEFIAGDMLANYGAFDVVVAMDSLIYYGEPDLMRALDILHASAPKVVFSLAPRTPLLMIMWSAGKLFPRADRSPRMVPHNTGSLCRRVAGLSEVQTVSSGFYTSRCMELAL